MATRRHAREAAVQFLYQFDLNKTADLDSQLTAFWKHLEKDETSAEAAADSKAVIFAESLIRGALEKKDEIDEIIKKHTENWELHRIATVDRNVLRLAIYEMFYRDDIPPVVSINEAVDIAKRYSTDNSGKFVNGILDRVKKDILRPHREAANKKTD